jgi:hypothetical protein
LRALVILVVGLTAAAALLAYVLAEDQVSNPAQVEAITVACPACHGSVPEYATVDRVHGRHAAFNCSRCHGGREALRATDTVHAGLEWLGLGGAVLISALIVADLFVVARKGR